MDIKINLDSLKDLEKDNIKVDGIKFQKMLLLFNSIRVKLVKFVNSLKSTISFEYKLRILN